MERIFCVAQTEKGLLIHHYEDFKESGNENLVHFVGTYKDCVGFITRSNAAKELIDSANREHEEYELITAEECLKELNNIEETYTREEVFLIAQRSIYAVINNILTENTERTIKQVINSEIDTVKLF